MFMGRGRICRVLLWAVREVERREGERGAGVWCKYLEIVCADIIGIWNAAYRFRSSFSLQQF